MKLSNILLIIVVVLLPLVSFAESKGDAEKGKELFNDPHLSGSTTETSCASCHPNGKGLYGVTEKKTFVTPAGKSDRIETAINQCVTMAVKGKALAPDSKEMQDLIAYLETLKKGGGNDSTK